MLVHVLEVNYVCVFKNHGIFFRVCLKIINGL